MIITFIITYIKNLKSINTFKNNDFYLKYF